MDKLKKLISTYKDYPKKGIFFKDVLEITQHPIIFQELIEKMASCKIIKEAEAIISIDARGFVFGSAIAYISNKPMIFARKPGKLPGKLIHQEYILEYGSSNLFIQEEVVKKFSSFAIVDDLLATGGTATCVSKLLEESDKKLTGLVVVVELENLLGRKKFKYPVESIIKYKN